jgi:hypothetical protein
MGHPGPLLFIVPPGLDGMAEPPGLRDVIARGEAPAWTWRPASEGLPQLPSLARRVEYRLETDMKTT